MYGTGLKQSSFLFFFGACPWKKKERGNVPAVPGCGCSGVCLGPWSETGAERKIEKSGRFGLWIFFEPVKYLSIYSDMNIFIRSGMTGVLPNDDTVSNILWIRIYIHEILNFCIRKCIFP